MKIAIVGLGVMGKNHYRVLKNSFSNIDFVLCDSELDKFENEIFYKNIDDMLKNEKIDGAIIAVPTIFHKDIAKKMIEKGIHILIEKPVAATFSEGKEILEYANKFGINARIGHIERFNPVVKSLKKELDGKEILSIAITRVGPIPPRITDVGVLTDLSVHDIDLIRYLTNKEIIDKNIYNSKKIHSKYEDNAVLAFRLENDIVAQITTNWLTPYKKRKIEVATREAYYEADLISQELNEYSNFNINNSFVIRNCFVKKGEPLFFELDAFVKLVSKIENKNCDLATIEDSMRTLEILGK